MEVAAPAEVGLAAPGLAAALARYRQCAEDEELPGGVLVVASKGRCCFLEAFGASDAESGAPLRTDAIFRAASMTKITTSLAAMMLVDRGQLLLDDPVSKYIPAFASMSRVTGGTGRSATTTPCATQITVRHLMAHTSGLTYGFFAGSGPCGVVDELSRELPRLGARSDTDEGEAEAAALAAAPLAFEPGSAFRYSCSTAVLGRVVSVASGVQMDAFLQAEICAPLGMVDTAYFVPPEKQHRVVTAYTRLDREAPPPPAGRSSMAAWKDSASKVLVRLPEEAQASPATPPPSIAADGGLFMTAPDWCKFMCMLSGKGAAPDGTRLLSEAAWEVMVAPATPDLGSDFCSHWSDPEGSAGPALCANFRGNPHDPSESWTACAPPHGLPNHLRNAPSCSR